MGISFPYWVYEQCFNTFARSVTYTPLKSQPTVGAFQARGIFDTNERDVMGMDESIFTDAKTELDIFMPEWSVLPLQGDMVSIPFEDDIDGGDFLVSDVQGHGNAGGELTLTLQRIVPVKATLPSVILGTGTFYVDSPVFVRAFFHLGYTVTGSAFSVGSPAFASPTLT